MAQTFHRYRAGDKPVGGYRLIRKLGEGGFGEVWQAAAPGGAEVALKFIDLTGQQGFREFKSLRLVKKITHNNLTPLHGFWLKNEDGTLIDESDVTWSQLAPSFPVDPSASPSSSMATAVYTHPVELIVAMGLGRKSLYDRLRECKDEGLGGIPADELLDYMEDAAKGIDYLNKPIHDMGHGPVPIVHSDVKPHNILIVGDGAQVCDFGLAHAVESLRKTCQAPLTLAYAAPESFRGKPCDKSDQYSLAITYIELRTGSLPFDDTMTGYEVMTAHVQGLLDLSRLTQSEAAVIKKATSSMPQDRWRSCREMIVELRRALRLSTDSNFMVDPADAPVSRLSGPVPAADRARTMLPPNFPSGETSPFSGPTPSEVDPTLRTRTPTSVTPVVVPSGAQRPERVTQGGISTRAKLLMLVLALAICAAGGYAIWGPWDLSSLVRKAENDNNNEKKPEVVTTGNAHQDFDQLLEAKEFAAAFDLLREPDFTPEDRQKKGAALQTAWRGAADASFKSRTYQAALKDYVALAERFPASSDLDELKLMQARSHIGLGGPPGFKAAAKVLGELAVPTVRSTSRDRIFFLVKVLTEIEGEKKVDRLPDLYQVWKEHRHQFPSTTTVASDADLWTISPDEFERLKDARSAVVGHWLRSAENRTAPPQAADLEAVGQIVEIDSKNVDAWIAKADLHLALGPPEKLDEALRRRAEFTEGPSILLRRGQIVDAYWDLTDPSSSDQRITSALGVLPDLMSRFEDRRVVLATAARNLATRQDKYLPEVVAAVRKAAEETGADAKLKQEFAELLTREIPQRLSKESNFQQTASRLLRDCQLVASTFASVDEVPEVIRACQAECLLETGTGDARQVIGASGTTAYYNYVRARVFAGRGGDRAQVDASLKSLFDKQRPAIMDLAGRSQKAIALVDQVADQVRGPTRPFKVETLLNKPVEPTPQARAAYELLLKAHRWTEPSLLSTSARANLAVASLWINEQTKLANDAELARALSLEVAPEWLKNRSESSVDRQLAFSLFHTLLAAHADAKDDSIGRLRLQVAQEMIKLGGAGALDDADAASLYATVIRPVVALASQLRADAFLAEAAGLIEQYPRLNWKFDSPGNASNKTPSVPDKLDELYTLAIDASAGKVGDYFKHRAEARLKRQPPNFGDVLADARELKRFPKLESQGLALEGNALLFQSRAEKTPAQRYDKLNLAIKSLHAAEALARKAGATSNDALSTALYLLSLAHTERGNFRGLSADDQDRAKIVPKQEFEKAIKYAEEAIAMEGVPNLQYAYEAAANAYEDLAWHAKDRAEANFEKAVEHLNNAQLLTDGKSPEVQMALARCYYKMVVEVGVNPPKLNSTYSGHLAKARKALADAIVLVGEGRNPEVHLWYGKVIQASHVDERTPLEQAKNKLTADEYRDADNQFTLAFDAAQKESLSPIYVATYALARAEHSLLNPALAQTGSGAGSASAVNNLLTRAKELESLRNASTRRLDPLQEAAILRAKLDLRKGTTELLKALEKPADELARVKPETFTRSDAKLLELRLAYESQPRPDQISAQWVDSIVRDAITYSKMPGDVIANDQEAALMTAMELSGKLLKKDSSQVNAVARHQASCLQAIVDLKFPASGDFAAYISLGQTCAKAWTAAKETPEVYLALQTVTQRYFDRAVKSAEQHNAPPEAIKQLNMWRDLAYGKGNSVDTRQKSGGQPLRNPVPTGANKNPANR